MKQVLKVSDLEQTETKALKPIEFTYAVESDKGWVKANPLLSDYRKIVYLGKCNVDGDMFAAYLGNTIAIFKGHLNDGVY